MASIQMTDVWFAATVLVIAICFQQLSNRPVVDAFEIETWSPRCLYSVTCKKGEARCVLTERHLSIPVREAVIDDRELEPVAYEELLASLLRAKPTFSIVDEEYLDHTTVHIVTLYRDGQRVDRFTVDSASPELRVPAFRDIELMIGSHEQKLRNAHYARNHLLRK